MTATIISGVIALLLALAPKLLEWIDGAVKARAAEPEEESLDEHQAKANKKLAAALASTDGDAIAAAFEFHSAGLPQPGEAPKGPDDLRGEGTDQSDGDTGVVRGDGRVAGSSDEVRTGTPEAAGGGTGSPKALSEEQLICSLAKLDDPICKRCPHGVLHVGIPTGYGSRCFTAGQCRGIDVICRPGGTGR